MKLISYSIVLVAFSTIFGLLSANAAVNSVVTTQIPKAYKAQLLSTSGVVTLNATTNYTSIAIGAANGTKVMGITCASSDTVAHTLVFGVIRSSVLYPLATIPIGTGSSIAAAELGVLNTTQIPGLPSDSDGNAYLFLESTDNLEFGVVSPAVTTGTNISCTTISADF